MAETNDEGPLHDVKEDAPYVSFSAAALYETVRAEGVHEMERPVASLWWSGIAAGLCMSFSVFVPMYLLRILGDEGAAQLALDLGYTVGFVLVVLGRMQLFTENTITTVLPFLSRPSWGALLIIGRLWAVVFVANVVGGTLAAALGHWSMGPEDIEALMKICHHGVDGTFGQNLLRSVPAGFLVAAIVWLTRSSSRDQLMLVVLMTFIIGVGGFAHVIAGSIEVVLILFVDGLDAAGLIGVFVVPSLLGNVIGGTGLFALLAYGQVKEELVG